jgi:hypothetical protein
MEKRMFLDTLPSVIANTLGKEAVMVNLGTRFAVCVEPEHTANNRCLPCAPCKDTRQRSRVCHVPHAQHTTKI